MNEQIKVSVIIPMYNARDYITHCVDALLEQTLEDIEIIIINDCSPDDSLALCEERYGDNERVVLLSQPKNMGPGAARNAGIERARGEYISFVDSDDAILKDAFRQMYDEAKRTDADVLHIGGALIPFDKELGNDLSVLPDDKLIKILLDGDAATETRTISADIKERLDAWLNHAYHWNIWSKLFRRTFLLEYGIRFVDLSLAEDQNFAFHCLICADNYVQMPGFFYIYRIAVESLSRGKMNLAFLARLLRTAFSLSDCMEKTMADQPFFAGHPDYMEKVKAFCIGFLEHEYIEDCYRGLNRTKIEADETIQTIFRDHFGANAAYIAKLYCDAHDAIPAPEEEQGDMNTYEFWEKIVDEQGINSVIQI